MTATTANPLAYLELQTSDLPGACAFYGRLLGWRAEPICVGVHSYLTLEVGDRLEGGVVERDTERAFWLPYVEVDDIACLTERARDLGASVVLAPREGPAGWRSILATPAGAEIALWQPKR